jgi:hypothetical protein
VTLHVVAERYELVDDSLVVELDAVRILELFGDFVNALLGHRAGTEYFRKTPDRSRESRMEGPCEVNGAKPTR